MNDRRRGPDPADGDNGATASPWVDRHLVLNAVAVLKYRASSDAAQMQTVLDALGGYLSSGWYLEQRKGHGIVEFFFDWLECLSDLRHVTADMSASRPHIEIEYPESDQSFDLNPARTIAGRILDAAFRSGGRGTGVRVRVDDAHRLHVCLSNVDLQALSAAGVDLAPTPSADGSIALVIPLAPV